MKRITPIAASLVALTMLAAACGGDDDSGSGTTAAAATTEAASDTTAASTDSTEPGADTTTAGGGEPIETDRNGDGKVVIGIATPGPRDDGAYYQALVDGLSSFSTEHGFEEPIVVDNIKPEE